MSNIILFRGRAGVGKTTLSNELGKRLEIAIIRKDDIYDSIFDFIQDHDARNKFSYQLIYKIMQTNLKCNADLIIDAPFPEILELQKWINNNNGVLKPILCICSDEALWAYRFNQRKLDPKPNNIITNFEEMKKHYGDLRLNPNDGELVLDSVKGIELLMTQAQEYLAR
ncbi:AAA family ATPase [Paenibacillus sp. KN14-4R]|uniref:AAA family ATPase n=1 Tax=Paenibacillus sp. KN14-4R TaxID=3445773 RepID=UPI003F9ED1DD